MNVDLDAVRRLASADHGLAVVATTRRDGSVQASVVNAGVLDHPVRKSPVVGLVARGDAHKLALLRRSPRATVVWRAGWEWVSVEGPVDLIGPDDTVEGFDPLEPGQVSGSAASMATPAPSHLAQLLRDVFMAAGGTHEDWNEYDRVMAAERRTAVLVHPARITSNR